MKHFVAIFLILFTAVSCTVIKEVTTPQVTEDPVKAYLISSGIPGQYNIAFDEMIRQLESQFPKTNANKEEWVAMESRKEQAMAEIIEDLATVYREHFTEEELQAMTDFYLSDTGRKIIANDYELTQAQQETLDTFYGSEIGLKVIRKQVVLRDAIDRITFRWSSDLYSTGLSILEFDD